MKGKVIVLFLRRQQGYGSPKRPYSMQQIHLKMHKSCTSVNDLPACCGCPPAHLSNSPPQSDYGITKHTCRGVKGKGERCYEVRGPPVTDNGQKRHIGRCMKKKIGEPDFCGKFKVKKGLNNKDVSKNQTESC